MPVTQKTAVMHILNKILIGDSNFGSEWPQNSSNTSRKGIQNSKRYIKQSPKDKIEYVPLDPVADYVHILELNTRLRAGWKMLPNLDFKLKFQIQISNSNFKLKFQTQTLI